MMKNGVLSIVVVQIKSYEINALCSIAIAIKIKQSTNIHNKKLVSNSTQNTQINTKFIN